MLKLLYVIILLFAAQGLSAQEGALSYEQLEKESSIWPSHIKVIRTANDMTEGAEKKLDPNTTGLLLRVEGGLLLVDTGRQGVVRLRPEDTNVMELASANNRGVGDKTYSLLHTMIGNKLVHWVKEEMVSETYEGTEDITHYLLVYAPSGNEGSKAFIERLNTLYGESRKGGLEFVLMSYEGTRDAQYSYLEKSGIFWKTIHHNFITGYHRSLSLPVKKEPCAFLLDMHGKIVEDSHKHENADAFFAKLASYYNKQK